MSKTSEKYKTSYYLSKKNDRNTIVFIHGVGLTKEIWDQQVEFFKNYNILTYDLLGHGKTPLEKSQLTFDDYNKQLLNLIDELDLKKIHLVGFSLGSLIARHFASIYGNRLSSLILHGSIYKRSKDQKTVIQNRYEILKLDGPASRKSSLRRWFTQEFTKKNKEVYNKIYSMLENNDLKTFLKAYKLFIFYEDNDEMINKIKTNTLVTTGQFDVGSTPEMAKNLSNQIVGSKFIEIKNGKHLCQIECAKDFNKTIKEFIDNNYDKA